MVEREIAGECTKRVPRVSGASRRELFLEELPEPARCRRGVGEHVSFHAVIIRRHARPCDRILGSGFPFHNSRARESGATSLPHVCAVFIPCAVGRNLLTRTDYTGARPRSLLYRAAERYFVATAITLRDVSIDTLFSSRR